MTLRQVEEIAARARALVEAHERRFPGYQGATDREAACISALAHELARAGAYDERAQAAA